jgi:hypothetical protein
MAGSGSTTELVILSLGLSGLIGGSFLWFTFRDKKTNIVMRMNLLIMSLLFLINFTIFALYTFQELPFFEGTEEILDPLILYLNMATFMQFGLLFLLFPSPIFTERKPMLLAMCSLPAISISILLTSKLFFEHWETVGFLIQQAIFYGLFSLIAIRWYILHRTSDSAVKRNHAIAAVLLMFGLVGSVLTRWPVLFSLGGGDLYAQGFGGFIFPDFSTSDFLFLFHHALELIPILGMFVVLITEIMVPREKRDMVVLLLSLFFFLFGLVNVMVVKFIGPVLFVYLAIKFNLVDLSKKSIRNKVRLIAVLLATVWASSLFEIIQAFLPVPQILSAAIIGVILSFGIGWEQKIFDGIATISEDDYLSSPKEIFEEPDLFRVVMVTVVFTLLLAMYGLIQGGETVV